MAAPASRMPYIKTRTAYERFSEISTLWRIAPTEKLQSQTKSAAELDLGTTRTGEVFPTWKDAIKKRVSATTNFTDQTKEVAICLPYHGFNIIRYPDGRIWKQEWDGDQQLLRWHEASEAHAVLASAENRARSNAYQQLSSHFEGLTALGELRETATMLKKPLMGLRRGVDKYASHARKVRRGIARKRSVSLPSRQRIWADAASDLWLEYTWGWKPLISDVEDLGKAFRERLMRPQQALFKARADGDSFVEEPQVIAGYQHMRVITDQRILLKCTVQYKGAAESLLTSSSVADSLGIYPAAFVPTAWELCPYSWLADYFTNFGDVLSAWAVSTRTRFVWVNRTVRTLTEVLVFSQPATTPAFANWALEERMSTGWAVFKAKNVARVHTDDIPLPYLTTDLSWNLTKGLNVTALWNGKAQDLIFSRSLR